MTEKQKTRRS